MLQSLYFNLDLCSVGGLSPLLNKLSNLYLTSDPDPTMTYEVAVLEVTNAGKMQVMMFFYFRQKQYLRVCAQMWTYLIPF